MIGMKLQNKRISLWVPIIIVFVLISLIIVYVQSNDTLGVYKNEGDETTTGGVASTETPKIDLVTYTNEEQHYSIGIPSDWTRIIKSGLETYIHQPSATSVQVQIQPYTSTILNVNENDLRQEITNAGFTMLNMQWNSNNSYLLVYEENTSDEETDLRYAEVTFFDYQTIIRLVYTVEKQYADRMNDTMMAIIDSFTWESQNPLPNGVRLYYSTYGNYEFAYPDGWTTSKADNTYIAQDPQTGTVMSVTAAQSTASYAELNQNDYINFASKGRPNFVLTAFSHDGAIIFGQASYSLNNTPMTLIQYLMATGEYEYTLTFEVPQSAVNNYIDLINTIANAFRTR